MGKRGARRMGTGRGDGRAPLSTARCPATEPDETSGANLFPGAQMRFAAAIGARENPTRLGTIIPQRARLHPVLGASAVKPWQVFTVTGANRLSRLSLGPRQNNRRIIKREPGALQGFAPDISSEGGSEYSHLSWRNISSVLSIIDTTKRRHFPARLYEFFPTGSGPDPFFRSHR